MQIQRLNDGDFLIHIDCDLRSAHERKMFVAKDENGVLRNPENVPIIVRLGRGRKIVEFLGSGTYKSKREVCEMFGMSASLVSRICRSAFLSPAVVEKLVTGHIPVSRFTEISDQLLANPLWAEQHKLLGIE